VIGPGAVQTVRATISGKVTDSQTGATIFDATGANALAFPAVLSSLPADRQLFLLREIVAPWLLFEKSGLNAEAAAAH
jgi:hypothetical protein